MSFSYPKVLSIECFIKHTICELISHSLKFLLLGGNYLAVTKAEGWKAKQWYNLVAPEMFGKANIGETVADVPEKLMGRIIEVTLGELTNDLSKQNIKLLLKVDSVGGGSAYSKLH